MEQSLNALIEEAAEPMTREVLAGVKAEVTAGQSRSPARWAAYDKSFPDFYRALVHGGEESGALPTVLQHLADYLDARQALKQKTSLALLYPALVTVRGGHASSPACWSTSCRRSCRCSSSRGRACRCSRAR